MLKKNQNMPSEPESTTRPHSNPVAPAPADPGLRGVSNPGLRPDEAADPLVLGHHRLHLPSVIATVLSIFLTIVVQALLATQAKHGLPIALRLMVNAVLVGQIWLIVRFRPTAGTVWAWLMLNAFCGFIFLQLNPADVFKSPSTPYGGDNSMHSLAPAFMRDVFLPRGRLFGWNPDWYAGWPLYQFYFPFPNFFIAAGSYAVFGVRLIPYGVAFKFVVILACIGLPVSVYYFARKLRLPEPGPVIAAAATLPFLFDQYHSIYGGNILGVIVGEYSFSICLILSFFFLGALYDSLTTGRRRWLPALLFGAAIQSHVIPTVMAGAGALILVFLVHGVSIRDRVWRFLSAVVPGVLLASYWLVPFESNLRMTSDFSYDKIRDYRALLLKFTATNCATEPCGYNWPEAEVGHLRLVFALAAIGLVIGLWRRRRFTMFFTLYGAVAAVGVIAIPDGKLWNPRLVPFWDLAVYMVAAAALYELYITARQLWRGLVAAFRRDGAVGALSVPVAWLGLAGASLLALGPLWFTARWLPGTPAAWAKNVPIIGEKYSDNQPTSPVPGWSRGNFMGYEGDPRDPNQVKRWADHRAVMNSIYDVAKEKGCGRVFIETGQDSGTWGGSTHLWTLPYWTNGCVKPYEGMYYESSATTAYWFLAEAWVGPKDTQTFPYLPYPAERNILIGMEMMKMMGVKYLMAFTPELLADVRDHPEMFTEVSSAGDWHVFTIEGRPIVEALTAEPARLPDFTDKLTDRLAWFKPHLRDSKEWLDIATPWFNSPQRYEVPLVEGGLKEWQEVSVTYTTTTTTSVAGQPAAPAVKRKYGEGVSVSEPEVRPLPKATVSNFEWGDDWVSFDVDRTGVPVLVKVSYFPNWTVKGAKGPWRSTPNYMVVVPTSKHVVLRYEASPADRVGWTLTLVGGSCAVALARPRRRRLIERRGSRPGRGSGATPVSPPRGAAGDRAPGPRNGRGRGPASVPRPSGTAAPRPSGTGAAPRNGPNSPRSATLRSRIPRISLRRDGS